MRYMLESTIEDAMFSYETEELYTLVEDFTEEEKDCFIEYISTHVDALIDQLSMESFSCIATGQMNLQDVISYLVEGCKQRFENEKGGLKCVSQVIDDENTVVEQHSIPLYDYLCDLLDEWIMDSDSYPSICQFIERCLTLFVENARWHTGVVNGKSETWFGVDGTKPATCWFMPAEATLVKNVFSCEEDEEMLSLLVTDCDESMEVWYFEECGCELPDIQSIMAKR